MLKKSGTQTVQNSGPFRRTFGVGIRAANALPMSILTLAALLLALTLVHLCRVRACYNRDS